MLLGVGVPPEPPCWWVGGRTGGCALGAPIGTAVWVGVGVGGCVPELPCCWVGVRTAVLAVWVPPIELAVLVGVGVPLVPPELLCCRCPPIELAVRLCAPIGTAVLVGGRGWVCARTAVLLRTPRTELLCWWVGVCPWYPPGGSNPEPMD